MIFSSKMTYPCTQTVLELELIQTQMAQKPMLRAEVYAENRARDVKCIVVDDFVLLKRKMMAPRLLATNFVLMSNLANTICTTDLKVTLRPQY